MKTKQWVYNFNSLDPNNQLVVASAIVEELQDNERFLEPIDKYDNERSKTIRLFLDKIVKNASTKQELKSLQATLSCFQSLSADNKAKVIESLVSSIEHYHEIQDHEAKEKICQVEGHIMGEWKYDSWTTYEDSIIDHQEVHNMECHHEEWTRTCKRCGYQETVKTEPKEVRKKREEKERQIRIKELEKELSELKGKGK